MNSPAEFTLLCKNSDNPENFKERRRNLIFQMIQEYVAPGVGIRDRIPGILQYRSWKSGTGTGTGTNFKIQDWEQTQIKNLRDLGLGPGLKFEKSGTRNWDLKSGDLKSWDLKSGTSGTKATAGICGISQKTQDWDRDRDAKSEIRDSGSGLKIEKSGIRDWGRDSDLWNEGFRDSTFGDGPGD